MPVAGRRDGSPVRRDLAESDLELARMAVAELAGAATVTDPVWIARWRLAITVRRV